MIALRIDQKTGFAMYFLKNEANYWWESVRDVEEVGVITWKRFTELFLEKYFLDYMQNQMELKFFECEKGNISISEYEARFTELDHFVLEYVDTGKKKARRFQQGLRTWIHSRVAVFDLNTYSAVVKKAMIMEG